ncbi:MAG: hypothetical protein ACK5NB_02395 [Flavobacteriaceae bacterium]
MTNISVFGRTIALLSFVIGTCLFSFHLYFGEAFIPMVTGFIFVLIAVVLNIIVLTITLIYALVNKQKRLELTKTCGIMLLNIPVAVLYCYAIIVRNEINF